MAWFGKTKEAFWKLYMSGGQEANTGGYGQEGRLSSGTEGTTGLSYSHVTMVYWARRWPQSNRDLCKKWKGRTTEDFCWHSLQEQHGLDNGDLKPFHQPVHSSRAFLRVQTKLICPQSKCALGVSPLFLSEFLIKRMCDFPHKNVLHQFHLPTWYFCIFLVHIRILTFRVVTMLHLLFCVALQAHE